MGCHGEGDLHHVLVPEDTGPRTARDLTAGKFCGQRADLRLGGNDPAFDGNGAEGDAAATCLRPVEGHRARAGQAEGDTCPGE